MRLNPKKKKTMMVSRSHTIAPDYGDLSLGDEEFDEVKSLRILGVTLDSKLTFESHLLDVSSKAVRSLGVMRQTGKLFDCPRILNSYFNSCVLTSLENCAPAWMSSAESIWVYWIVLLAVRKCCIRMSFDVWDTEGRSMLCISFIRFITECTTV